VSSATSEDAVRQRYRAAAATSAESAAPVSFGAGDLLRFAALRPGETVLDLGSGAGVDVLGAADAVGAAGRVIGVDMLAEMCEQARKNSGHLANVSVRQGDMAALPLPDACVDVVISNCVINLARDKTQVLRETHRVLAPGGRLVVVDTAFAAEPDADVRTDMTAWSCCVGGALTIDRYRQVVEAAGYDEVAITDLGAFDASRVSDAEVRSVLVTARRSGDGPAVVRPAVPADLDAVHGLLAAEGLPLGGFDVHATVVALDDEGRVAGAVMLERFDGGFSFLRSLVVAPARRGHGLGHDLVAAAVAMAAGSGASDTFLLTAGAEDFFAPLGFGVEHTAIARAACPSAEFDEACCGGGTAMRLRHAPAESTAACCPPG
jgi:arsenite methyltransferase